MTTTLAGNDSIDDRLKNATSAAPAVVGITQFEFWIHIVLFYCILGGVCSTCGNIAMAVGIARCKDLRSRFFVIIWFLLVARAVTDFELFVLSVHRTLRALNMIPTCIKRIYCFLIHFHLLHSLTSEMVILLGLLIDRAMAIVAFYYYRTLTYRHAVVACSIAVVITSVLKIVPALFGIDFNETIPCINGYSSFAPLVNAYNQNIDLFLGVLTLVLYIFLILYVRYRFLPFIKSVGQQTGDFSRVDTFNSQAKLLPLLRRLVLIHCGLTLLAKVLMSVSGFVPEEAGLRLVAYGGMLLTVDHFSTVVVMLTSNKDIRRAALNCFSQVVTPEPVVPNTTTPQNWRVTRSAQRNRWA